MPPPPPWSSQLKSTGRSTGKTTTPAKTPAPPATKNNKPEPKKSAGPKKEAPDPPAAKPFVAKCSDEILKIVWPGTTYDGGCIVTGYLVEMYDDSTKKWKVLTKNVFSTGYDVKGLKNDGKYKFRVSCINEVGTSKPSAESDFISPKEHAGEGEDEEDAPDEAAFEPRNIVVQKKDPKTLYDIKEELGKGRFGTVNKCVEKSSKKVLAAKHITANNDRDRQEVEHEIEIMKVLQHPRLLQLYDAFDNGKNMVMILEYVSGGELFERVIDEEFDLTEKECTFFLRQICDGVRFMHSKAILHLDMKPENILCIRKNSNKIKIIDFGLAQKMTPGLQVSCGTPEFLAPEVVSYDEVSKTTDMWSVGVICYVLLSGLSPFMGDHDGETMTNILKVEYDFDDECFDEISDLAKDFIEKLLQEDQEDRMTADDCLEHDWLKKELKTSIALKKGNLRKYVIKRRWQKAINAVRAAVRVKMLAM
ncbi:myosin light chain kinase, smooth muscle-like [Apostichopus japonicus]|uniref:myosin light chain kinase, smooth muscle-like n=1 Tax=Stichopus japonicus TaxID=307972 RepID=UPI003AB2C327